MKTLSSFAGRTLPALILALATLVSLAPATLAQTTGGTQVTQTATGSYDDGEATPTTYNAVSNTITIEVANVSGLVITPDAGSVAAVVPGQSGVAFTFAVTNASNYAARVRFPASGAAAVATNGTVTAAFVDLDSSGTFTDGDINIFSNGSAVSTDPIDAGDAISVVVVVNVSSSAPTAGTVTVRLGDAGGASPYDNVESDGSAGEVRTDSTGVSPAPANGESEARGSASATVEADASLAVNLSPSSAGPLDYGDDITYTLSLSNAGARAAQPVTISGQSGVYLIANVPANTALKAGQSWPAGTLFSQDALSVATLAASYSTTEPSAASVNRVAFRVGAGLAASTTSGDFTLVVTIDGGPFDATSGVTQLSNAYATNHVGSQITDDASATTTVTLEGAVLLGTFGHPDAQLTTTDDDYTNKSTNAGINAAVGGVTNAPGTVVFRNTLKNTGNATDSFTITAPLVGGSLVVEASTDGVSYTDISDGATSITVSNLAFDQTATVYVRATAPAGSAVLSSFPTHLRAASVRTPASTNDTHNNVYTGYVLFTKASSVSNPTGRGGATDAVPGAVITYTLTYQNLSSSGGTNCFPLTAHNLVITEDGLAAGNNWGTHTDPTGTPSDSGSGSVATVSATKYTDTITSLAPGASGTFTFQRVIK